MNNRHSFSFKDTPRTIEFDEDPKIDSLGEAKNSSDASAVQADFTLTEIDNEPTQIAVTVKTAKGKSFMNHHFNEGAVEVVLPRESYQLVIEKIRSEGMTFESLLESPREVSAEMSECEDVEINGVHFIQHPSGMKIDRRALVAVYSEDGQDLQYWHGTQFSNHYGWMFKYTIFND